MTFDEYTNYNKSRKKPPEEAEAPRIHDTTMNEETQGEDQEFEEPQRPVDCSGTQGTPKRLNTLRNHFTQIDYISTHRCLSRG